MSWNCSWGLNKLWIDSEENPKICPKKTEGHESQGAVVWLAANVRPRRSSPKTSQKRDTETKMRSFFGWGQKQKHPKKDTRNETKATRNTTFGGGSISTSFSISKKKKKCLPLITFHFSEVQRFQSFSFCTWGRLGSFLERRWKYAEGKIEVTNHGFWGYSVHTLLDADFLECFCERVCFSVAHNIRKHTHSKADSLNNRLQRNCSQCTRKNSFKESMGPCWICLMLPHTSCHEWICWDSAQAHHSETWPVFLCSYVPQSLAKGL